MPSEHTIKKYWPRSCLGIIVPYANLDPHGIQESEHLVVRDLHSHEISRQMHQIHAAYLGARTGDENCRAKKQLLGER